MKLILTTFFITIFFFSWGQENLITNGSFEDLDSCYGAPSPLGVDAFHLSGCTGWTCPSYASSDLWCTNPFFQNNEPPQNLGSLGDFQYPRTGSNMVGVVTFAFAAPNYREYIQNNLAHELEKNTYYDLTFYINASYSGNYSSCVQAYFSDNPITQLMSYEPLIANPQIKNDTSNYITDTLNWTKLTFLYKAKGGEKYVTIGCFDDYPNINLTIKDTNNFAIGDVYFYFDDLSLVISDMQVEFPNVFTPNNDGINDYFFPQIVNVPNWKCYLYNRWGNLICTLDNSNNKWDGKINGKYANDGVYYYTMESNNQELNENGFFTLTK